MTPTFRTNTTAQAEAYQAARTGYANTLINELLAYHTATGGQSTTILDVGCGPGTATRSLSPHFQHAYACDPSESMISTAKDIASTTQSGSPITYAVGPAEELDHISFPPNDRPLTPGSIDLITCAMSAHWFSPISAFYSAAGRLLRPGGTLAMWTASSYYCHPHTTPNAEKVQAILFDLERRILRPFEMPGNRLSMDAYANLLLPWDSDASDPGFDESTFVRKEWNRDGKVEKGQPFLALEPRHSLDDLAKGCSTASMVVRWRAAHKEQLEKGEVEDCVDSTIRRLKEALDGQDWMEGGPSTALLMMKKKEA